MKVHFAIFPGGKKVWVRYCDCGVLMGAVSAGKRKLWNLGNPSKKQQELLRVLKCSHCDN